MGRWDGRVSLASVIGAIEAGVEHVDGVGFLRGGKDVRVIPRTLAEVTLLVDLGPGLAAVIGSEDAALLGLDDGPDAVGINGRHCDPDAANDAFRETGVSRDFVPRVSAIGGLIETAIRTPALK